MLPMNTRPAKGTKTPRTSAAELRNAGDRVSTLLTDYCACMAHERATWLLRAARVREEIVALPYCPRASASDREYVERMVQRLDDQVAKVTQDLAAREAQKAATRPVVLRLVRASYYLFACFALAVGCGSADVSERPMVFAPVENSEEPKPKTVCVSERAAAADPDLHQIVTAAFAYWDAEEDVEDVEDVARWQLVEPSDDCDVPILFSGESVGWKSETQAAGLLAEGRMEPGKCEPYTILLRQDRWDETVKNGWAFPVLAHEIGHMFCLPHSDDPDDVMSPSIGMDG